MILTKIRIYKKNNIKIYNLNLVKRTFKQNNYSANSQKINNNNYQILITINNNNRVNLYEIFTKKINLSNNQICHYNNSFINKKLKDVNKISSLSQALIVIATMIKNKLISNKNKQKAKNKIQILEFKTNLLKIHIMI